METTVGIRSSIPHKPLASLGALGDLGIVRFSADESIISEGLLSTCFYMHKENRTQRDCNRNRKQGFGVLRLHDVLLPLHTESNVQNRYTRLGV